MSKTKFQASPLSRYGTAGPPIQHFEGRITIGELRDLIKHEKIEPSKLFEKEDFIKDEKLISAMKDKMELEDYRAGKDKEKIEKDNADSMIPDDKPGTLTEAEKRQQEKDNELVADDKPGEDEDLIPD